MKKMVIAGGAGFLGQVLSDYFVRLGYEIVVLSRSHRLNHGNVSYVKWDGKSLGYWVGQLEGAAALINLSGRSVDCRYTQSNKQLIYDTRIESTFILGEALKTLKNPPKIWINASSATIYRHAMDRDMDESTGELGLGFSVDVCKKWEQTFYGIDSHGTRKVALRLAIVFGKNGGALSPLKALAKLGLGGRQGCGEQYFSWIHEHDFCRSVRFILENIDTKGTYNVSSPNPIPNYWIMRNIRSKLRVSIGWPIPAWLLKLGAFLIRTETELLLKSRRVVPSRLLSEGFTFNFPTTEQALEDLLTN